MDRRKFLKFLASGVAAAVAVPAVAAEMRWINGRQSDLLYSMDMKGGFDPCLSYGNYVRVTDADICDYAPWAVETVRGRIRDDMRSFIPRSHWCGVRFIHHLPGGSSDPLMCGHSFGWKYTPEQYRSYNRLFYGANRSGKTDSVLYDFQGNLEWQVLDNKE